MIKLHIRNSLGIISAGLCLAFSLAAYDAGAQVTNLYFDVNGTTTGSGVTAGGNYSWETANFWNTNALGTTPGLTSWSEGNFPEFSAGSDATGSYTITASSNHVIAGMLLRTSTGTVTVTGPGVLSITNAGGAGVGGIQQGFFSTGTLVISNTLAGPGGVIPQSGTLQLYGNNTYTGGTELTGTLVYFNQANSFGTGTITPIATGSPGFSALLSAGGASITLTNAFNIATVNGGVNFASSASTPVICSGPFNLATTFFCRNNGNTTAPLTLSGILSGVGGLTLSANNSGTITLNGANTYTGQTSIGGNGNSVVTVSVSSINRVSGGNASSSLGAPITAPNGTINIGNTAQPGVLVYTGAGETSDRVINLIGTTGGGTIEMDGAGPLVLTSAFTATGAGVKTLTLQGTSTATNSILGAIVNNSSANTTALTKAQAGNWILDGVNTFTGNTSVTGGTLTIGGSGSLNSGAYAGTVALSSGATLNYASSTSQALSNVVSGAGALTVSGSGTLTLRGTNTYTGITTINSGSTLAIGGAGKVAGTAITDNGTLNIATSSAFTVSNAISGSGTFDQSGTATTTLNGTNSSFTGPVNVTGGLLAFNNDGNLGAVPSSFTNEFTLNGGPNSGLRAASTDTINANRGILLGANGGEIQVAQNDTCTYNGVISGSGPFQDGQNASTGLGVLVLTGAETYTNTTTIACGTLRLLNTASLGNSSSILMSNASILDVSNFSAFALSTTNAFTAIGTASTADTILGPSGGSVNFGSQPVTLSFVPAYTTGDPTNVALTISQGTLALNGNTFNVTNASALALGPGNYTLIQQAAGNVNATGPFTLNLFGTALAPNTTASIGAIGGAVVLQVQPTGGNANAYFSNLTASQSAVYGTPMATISGTVSAAGPVYPTNGETVNITIGGVVTNTTINDNMGDFTLTAPINTIPVGTYLITYSYAGNATVPIGAATDTSTTLTITKAPLTVTANAQSKTYGQVITFGSGNTNFTSVGLQNTDTIGTVTLAVTGSGGAANASVAASPYTITPSAATGGTFSAGNYSITYVTNLLTVNPEPLTITANSQSKTYGQNVVFGSGSTAFGSSGLTNSETIGSVTLSCSGGVSNAPVSGSPYTITPSAATGGTFNVTNYTIAYVTNLLTVNPATLTITATSFAIPYGATNPALTVTYSNFVNGETVGTSDLSGSMTLTCAVTNDSDVGVYVITNSIGTLTSTNYSLNLVNGTFTITNAISTNSVVATPNPASPTAGLTFTSTLSTLAPSLAVPTNAVQFLLDGVTNGSPVYPSNGVATITNAPLPVGFHTIEADYAGDTNALGVTNILGSTNTVVLAVNATPVFSGLTASPTIAYGATSVSLSGTVSAGSIYPTNGETVSATINGFTVNGTVIDTNGDFLITYNDPSLPTNSVGVYTITYSYAGNPAVLLNAAANDTSTSLTINQASLTITANNDSKTYGQTKTYGAGSIAFMSSGLQNGETIGSVTITASGGTAPNAAVGPYSLIPSAATGGTFNPANYSIAYNDGTLTVGQAPLLITANPQTITYGATVPGTTVTYTGFVNGETNTALTTQPTVASANSGVVAAGTYAGNYTASGAAALNYNISYAAGTLTVDPASLLITANPQTILYGACVPAGTVSYSGFVNGDTNTALTTQPTVVSSNSGLVLPGTYPGNYTASGAVDSNYTIAYAAGNLMVNLAAGTPTLSVMSSFANNGWLAPSNVDGSTYPYLGNGNTERGIAYGDGNLFLVSRIGSNNVRMLNPTNGTDLGGFNTTGMSGGTFAENAIAVGGDGTVYVGNLTTSATSPFIVYKWTPGNFSSAPTVAYSGNPLGGGTRLGDDLAAIGSGASTLLVAGYGSGSSGYEIIAPTGPTATAISFTGSPPNAGDFRLGITFTDSSHVIGTQGSTLYRYSSYSGSTGTLVASPALSGSADRPLGYVSVGGVNLMASVSTGDNHVALYNMADPTSPVIIAQANATTGSLPANGNASGGIAWGSPTFNSFGGFSINLYAMSTQDGIQAFIVNDPGQNAIPQFTGLSSPSIAYGTASVILTGNVGTNTCSPIYPTNGEPVSATINGHTVTGATTDTNGDFSITFNDPSLATNNAGSYAITYAYGGNTNIYLSSAISTNATLTVNPADQTITFGALADQTYGVAPYGLSASASSGLPVSFTVVSGPASITGTNITITGGGTVYVAASQAGNANYNAATPVTNSFTVNPTNQTITFGSLADQTYGVAPYGLSASASSSLPVSFAVASGPAMITGSTITITGAGTVSVAASQAGNSNYTAATPVTNSFSVAQLTAILTGTRPYDGTAIATNTILSVANAVGSDDVDVASGSAGLASASVGTNAINSFVSLTLGGVTAPNYTLAGASGSVVITDPGLPFSITSVSLDGTGTNLVTVFQSVPGDVYQMLSSSNAASALITWTNVGGTITATDMLTTNVTPISALTNAQVYIYKNLK